MDIKGLWKVTEVMQRGEEGIEFVAVDDNYIASADPGLRMTLESIMDFRDDGFVYTLCPIPAGVSKEQIEEAVKAGQVEVTDDFKYMVKKRNEWKCESESLVFFAGPGEESKVTIKVIDDNKIEIMGFRYERA